MIVRDPKLYCARADGFSKTIEEYDSILVAKSFRQDGIRLMSGGRDKIMDDQLVTGFNSSFSAGGIVEAIMDDAYYITPDGMQRVANASLSTAFQNAQFFFHQPKSEISGLNAEIDIYFRNKRKSSLREKLTGERQYAAVPKIISMAGFFEGDVLESQCKYEIHDSREIPFSYFTYWSTRINSLGYGDVFFAYTRDHKGFIDRLMRIAKSNGHDCTEVILDAIPVH